MGQARSRMAGLLVIGLVAAAGLQANTLAQVPAGQSIMMDNLGPPLPSPGQPGPVGWYDRLRWLQQQLRVLGHDPGPNQELFRRLSQQVDAVVAAAPAVQGPASAIVTAPAALWPARPDTGADMSAGPPQPAAGTQTPQEPSFSGAGGTTQAPAPQAGAGIPGARPSGPPPGHEALRIFQLAHDMERSVMDPLQATILAVYGIVDAGKDNPQLAVSALQSLLEKEQSVPGRTIIYFGLKDALLQAGQREQAIQQLQSIVTENDRLLMSRPGRPGGPPPQFRDGPPPRRPGMPPGPAPEPRGELEPGRPGAAEQ